MTAPYRHLDGGNGAVAVPGGLDQELAPTWNIACYLWSGSEYWTAQRRQPTPPQAADYGVCAQYRGWSDTTRMRAWLTDQAAALTRWQTTSGLPPDPPQPH